MKTATEEFELQHPESARKVPVRRYLTEEEPLAWVILSVGYGGDRTGYAYLGRSWASFGITTLVVEHVGSNLEVLRSLSHLPKAERNREVVRRVTEPEELRARPADLALVHAHMSDRFAGLPLGLCGHSFGSYTVLAGLGLQPLQTGHSTAPLPARTVLVMSPQPPGMLFSAEELGRVPTPILVLTGTEDRLLDGSSGYRDRLDTFLHLPSSLRRLTVLEGVEHMTFAGIGLRIEAHLDAIRKVTSLWWTETLLEAGSSDLWSELLLSQLDPAEVAECR